MLSEYWDGEEHNLNRGAGTRNFSLLTWANIDIIRQVWSKYLIERKTMLEGGVELSQENY